MLLPWFNTLIKGELLVLIQPQRIILLHLNRPLRHGFKAQLVHKQAIALPQNLNLDAQFSQETLQILRQLLDNELWRGLPASVVLSNNFVRFAVIPWNTELITNDERQAFILHCFTQAFGEVTKAWNFSVSTPSFGRNAIASAVSQTLLQNLHTIFTESNLHLVAVRPHLMLAINQTLAEIKKHQPTDSFWLITIMAGQMSLVLFASHQWRVIKNVALDVDVSAQVGALIQREMINNDIEMDLPKLLYWPESHYTQPIKLAGFEMIKVLPTIMDSQHSATLHYTNNLAAA